MAELMREKMKRMGFPDATIPTHQSYSRKADCTEETQEIKEPEEPEVSEEPKEEEEGKETKESHESKENKEPQEIKEVSSVVWSEINQSISRRGVIDKGDVNKPLFYLAWDIRGYESRLGGFFPLATLVRIIDKWKAENIGKLDDGHDYLTELVDKLSLVRYPPDELLDALKVAVKEPPPAKTLPLSPPVQHLACLCRELQRREGSKPFFLDGRSAAKVLDKPHETVASWLRALRRLKLIELVTEGRRGHASRYRYVALD